MNNKRHARLLSEQLGIGGSSDQLYKSLLLARAGEELKMSQGNS
jgi:hypothetical protein